MLNRTPAVYFNFQMARAVGWPKSNDKNKVLNIFYHLFQCSCVSKKYIDKCRASEEINGESLADNFLKRFLRIVYVNQLRFKAITMVPFSVAIQISYTSALTNERTEIKIWWIYANACCQRFIWHIRNDTKPNANIQTLFGFNSAD